MSKDWPIVALGDVLKRRKQFVLIDDLQSYKRPRVQLHARGVVLRDEVPGALIKTKQQQVCKAGEFLVAEIDAKVGGYGLVPHELDGAIVSSHYFLFASDEDGLDRRFLEWFIKTPAFRDQVKAQGSTNYAAIRAADVLRYQMPLPPLDEQQRIVARIEEMADRIQAARQVKRQTVQETGVLADRAAEGVFQTLAAGGAAVRPFAEVCSQVTVGHVSSMRHAYRETGVPFLRSQNVRRNRFEPAGLCFIDPTFHQTNPKSALHPGDVVLVRTGFVGVACVIPPELTEANCADLVIVRPGALLDPYYAAHFLNSPTGKARAVGASVGSAQRHYNVGAMKITGIPLPDIEKQREVVEYLNRVDVSAQAIAGAQVKSTQELDALLPAILDRAFKGEL